MPGEREQLYVRAREVLLDALDALEPHLDRIVLIGAQAVYRHTQSAELAIAPFTQDADLALDPRGLSADPLIEGCLNAAGFVQGVSRQPGCWFGREGVEVDLMVPATLAGDGRRSADIPPHDRFAARSAHGIEAVLVDNEWHEIPSLVPGNVRGHRVRVAGPAALLVAKSIKLSERAAGAATRLEHKDALDIYRLLLATETAMLSRKLLALLAEELTRATTTAALVALELLFDVPGNIGEVCLRAALDGSEHADVAPVQARLLVRRLISEVRASQ
ncbi:MAG: hypothetical protein IT348_01215 [Candidatus Eisenbacteria bacterium]|nr:hypothetical protein [Candidatus Eisenbacteria bacterium]